MAVTTPTEPKGRPWRARASVQPLLTTILGVVVSVVLYVVVFGSMDRCSGCGAGAGGAIEILNAIKAIPVALVGLLITGLVVGLLSHDAGPALRAVVVGVMVPLLILGVALVPAGWMVVANGDYVGATGGGLAFGAVVGLVLLIPAALGFSVGRLDWHIRRRAASAPVDR